MAITQAQRDRMRDYVVEKLEGCGENIRAVRGNFVPGIESSCVLVGEDGIVLLVDQKYTNDRLPALSRTARECKQPKKRINVLIYKDGETFFRSAMAGEEATGIVSKRSKQRHDRSLSAYNNQDLNRMIGFRPEELFAFRHGQSATCQDGGRWMQYYQPASAELQEGIVTYRFKPVVLDNTNNPYLSPDAQLPRDSKLTYIWREEKENHGLLKLGYLYLLPRDTK